MVKNIPDPQRIHSISCPKCASHYIVTHLVREPRFCAMCGLPFKKETESSEDTSTKSADEITLVEGHEPSEESVKFSVGPYKVISSIGRGGMGEVFLAYDTTCGRRLALKKIRDDFSEHSVVEKRFLKEARITSQLTHPAIIPIYNLHAESKNNFYTMPYVEGDTLKQILRRARLAERRGEHELHSASSIPSLIRHFITICQAVAYAHSKKVLHRDLKPENIIVGKFGEVLILDWGLAKMWNPLKPPFQPMKGEKVVGTLAYMSPERVLGVEASPQSDIYALGVILYQILTLKMPFSRGSFKEYKKNIHKEVLVEPSEVSPWREVPRILSRIVMRCLEHDSDKRYESVLDLISDIDIYIEGRAEFFPIALLDIERTEDWEFQENVLIAEHMAITRNAEHSDWVNLMISKMSFSENIRIETKVIPGKTSLGIGFLLSVPESAERDHLIEGYCLWLGTRNGIKSRLLKSTIEVLEVPEIVLESGVEATVRIEKLDKSLRVWINDRLELSYVSHIPITGTHTGLLLRDFDIHVSPIEVYEGSQNILVNCLSIPDAFLARKDYSTALSEYRRIAYSFPGRSEGREAAFRAGVVLLEQGSETTDIEHAHQLFDLALEEFEKLHNTPGAPLEYLGKALVYHALADYEEEIKCYELAFRRYPQHPLLPVLEEQILFRMHECSKTDRKGAYAFILLVLQFLPSQIESHPVKRVLDSIAKHSEKVWFMESPASATYERRHWGILLAYWLEKPWVIEEILNALKPEDDPILMQNGVWSLKLMGEEEAASHFYEKVYLDPQKLKFFEAAKLFDERHLGDLLEVINGQTSLPFICLRIQTLMLQNKIEEAGEELMRFPLEWHTKETTLLPFLYGCWLFMTEGRELAWVHFAGTLETAFPRTCTLGSLALIDKLPLPWKKRAFPWELKELARQLKFFQDLPRNI